MRILRYTFTLIILVTVLLSACKPTTPEVETPPTIEATSEPGKPQPTVKPTEPTAEEVTITVWALAAGLDWIESIAIPAFEETNPNIKVELVLYPEEEYGLKIETAVATKETPDIALLVLFNAPRVAPVGGLLDLAPYMEKANLTKQDFCPSIDSRFNVLNDTLYAIPMDTNIWAMMINKDLFADAGLPELSPDSYITYDDWLEYARALTKPSDDYEEYVWGSALFWPRWNSMNNYMSSPFFLGDDGRTCVGNADTEDWINFYEASLAAYNEDLMPESASTYTASIAALDLFKQGRLGMIYGSLGQAYQTRDSGINVGLAGQPVVSPGWKGNVGSWESSWSIFTNSKHPDEAWKFIQFLAEKGALMVATSDVGFGSAAMPCYKLAQEEFIEASGNDILVQQAITLLDHVQAPPWTVDAWTSSTPFEEAWRRMTEDGVDILTAVTDGAIECQSATDSLWSEWEALSE